MDSLTIAAAPSPWTLRGDAWWFVLSVFGQSTHEIDASYHHPFEASSAKIAQEPGNFKGGIGLVVLVRYTDSPFGPYDELLIVPGAFDSPPFDSDRQNLRVTRLYVSTLASVVNGRRNWNMAKHLARFEFTEKEDKTHEVRVYPLTPSGPGDNNTYSPKPCFAAHITPSWFLPAPAIPFHTKLSPFTLDLVQPPLEQSEHVDKDGLVGTDVWQKVLPSFSGKMKLVRMAGLLEGDKFGDGKDFPDITPWKTGIHWPNVTIDFPESQQWKDVQQYGTFA